MRVSLITATLGRTDTVAALLASLEAQTFRDFELLIVDQNGDSRLSNIVETYASSLAIRHLHSDVRRLSHARNLGIAECTGEIVGFPDDDCIYPPEVLAHVVRHFSQDPTLGMLSGPSLSPSGERGSGRWEEKSGPITMRTVWTSVIAFNFFLRRDVIKTIGGFDETLGVGAKFGSAEETDLAIRILRSGGCGWFDAALNVIHPDKRLTVEATLRAYSYGTGLGRVLRKHPSPWNITTGFFVRPLGGMVISLARIRFLYASYYLKTFLGRMAGYLAF